MAKPIEEQAKIEDKDLKGLLAKLKLNDEKNINPDIHLGIYYKKKDSEKEFRTFNYIGVDWLSDDRNKINKDETDYIIVKPKVKDLDFMKLFSSALGIEDEKAYTYFNDYFNIDFNVPRIKAQDSELDSYITPLLLFSYIQ